MAAARRGVGNGDTSRAAVVEDYLLDDEVLGGTSASFMTTDVGTASPRRADADAMALPTEPLDRVTDTAPGSTAADTTAPTNAVGAALPLFGHSVLWLATSALVFGVSFFALVGSTTAFVRFNYPPAAWPAAIAAMTISFGVGQILGPTVTGAITDATGSLSSALSGSAAMLALGAVLAAFQRKLGTTT